MKIMIVGATSAIAQSVARTWATQDNEFFLLARNEELSRAVADDLRVRGAAAVSRAAFEASDFDSHARALDAGIAALGGVDLLLVSHGSLADQSACESDFGEVARQFAVNALSVMSVLTHVANVFARQRRGTIVVIGSVAGDRGRRSNYVYGSAKAAVDTFSQGLRSRLHPFGVRVITVKPGLIDSPMTTHLKKGAIWSTPHAVALAINRALSGRRDVVYAPGAWSAVMRVIRWIPEPVFKTLNF